MLGGPRFSASASSLPSIFSPTGCSGTDRIITKPPSAELKPDQTDQDTLPPYDELDAILQCLVEKDLGVTATTAEGHDQALVERIWRMLLIAEYKRRQAPPGVKITQRSFGSDRRYPITNGFRDARPVADHHEFGADS